MIDSTKIDALIVEARARDTAVTDKLKGECARLVVVDQYQGFTRNLSADTMATMLRPARYVESTNSNINQPTEPPPENGSYAIQLFSAICFAIDARAELKLLELIASPTFYDAIMRSAAEK